MSASDTIYACASGAAPAAIAVYRLSGPDTDAVLRRLGVEKPPAPRLASLRRLKNPETGALLDEALLLRFVEGASYTGEASAELHVHGGRSVRSALAAALEQAGARLAEPGEFTRRAVLNGRMDVAQAESVVALIEAESEAQRLQALEILDGAVGRLAERWRAALIDVASRLEIGVDFVEEDLGAEIEAEALVSLRAIGAELAAHAAEAASVEKDVSAPVIALIGRPNAGKSSLLNAIAQRDEAIVSDRPGTTRDAVTTTLRFKGAQLRLVDTAGQRATEDEIEAIGVERARKAAEGAERRILVVSGDTEAPDPALLAALRPGDAIFWTKSDAAPPVERAAPEGVAYYAVSSRDDTALRAFEDYIESVAVGAQRMESPIAGSARRAALVGKASDRLKQAIASLEAGVVEACIEDLRRASALMRDLIGAIDHEDVLDAVFSRFCIGK